MRGGSKKRVLPAAADFMRISTTTVHFPIWKIAAEIDCHHKSKRQGIVIVRKMNDGKSFEFNFPITVASRIASAIEIIMKNNGN